MTRGVHGVEQLRPSVLNGPALPLAWPLAQSAGTGDRQPSGTSKRAWIGWGIEGGIQEISSYFNKLIRERAEGVGFEPTNGFPYTRFPSVRLKPLGHPSGIVATRPI